MKESSIFNIAVCIIGLIIFLIHIVNMLMKKNRRSEEKVLLTFLILTAAHFGLYLIFTFIKESYTSDPLIMTFYTIFYITNNLEVMLLFYYLLLYAKVSEKLKNTVSIINLSLFIIFFILDIANIFTHMFFSSVGGVYTRADFMIVSQGYQFIMFTLIVIIALTNKRINIREKIGFSLYCLVPLIAIIIQNKLKGYAIAYMSIIFSIEILVLFLDVEKNRKLEEEEKKIKEAYINVMVSQIKPHFIYNTLSSISTLIKLDPNKAQVALDDFTEYLRMNFTTLTDTRLVSFENELKHIKTYIALEKMRFEERLTVEYDLKITNFEIPPLSIQPLVENAIKHGILQKIEGGTLIIKTYEDNLNIYIEVIDDGIGFNLKDIDFTNNEHIGLNNIKHRLSSMCNGKLEIISEVNKGTRVIVTLNK